MRVGADARTARRRSRRSNVAPDEGDEWVRVGGIKLGVDGGFEGGWMREPYVEPWGEDGTFYGVNTMKAAAFTERREGAESARMARRDARRRRRRDRPRARRVRSRRTPSEPIAGKRWTIEHGFIPRDDQFPRMKALGSRDLRAESPVPRRPEPREVLGPERAAWTTPVRAYLDRGLRRRRRNRLGRRAVPAALGDLSLRHRDTISGGVLGADQKITPQEALQVERSNNAYLTFEEQTQGLDRAGQARRSRRAVRGHPDVPDKRHRADAGRD